MNKLAYLIPLLLGMALTSCYDEEIEKINGRLDAIENTQIATISQQITSINNSILLLNGTDKELGEYISALEAEAENLQSQITATNTKIDEVNTEILSTISSEKANILAELEALRNTTTARLEEINATIAELQAADGDMSAQIEVLEAEAAQLEVKLAETNTKIDTVKSELTETISTEKANILAELEAFKATVNGELDAIKAVLETLKAKDAELDGKIATLQEYVDTELKATEDWATATFSTLEQYNEVVATIATIEGTIEGINESIAALETRINEKIAKDIETACASLSADLQNAVKDVTEAYTSAIATAKNELTEAYTAALEGAISALETSMKEWVNEQLTGYYTIAEIDAKLKALETATTEGDGALQKEIDALRESLAAQKTELTEAYTAAITEAITANNGVIDEKIATEIAAVNENIGALEERLNSLEERISAVEDAIEQIKALDIIFSNTDELACLAGANASVDYTIVGGDEQTTIEAFGDGGWSADIVAESATAGKVVVTAPSEISKRGKVVVLATSGAGGVAMKSLHFDEGVLTGVLDTYEVDWEACTLAVTLKTNLSYSVEIPADAQAWISIAETTRATVRTETITLSIAENPEDMPDRSVVVKLVGECGDVLQSFEVTQKLRPSSNPIVFADPIVKQVCVEKFDTNGDGELSELEASRVRTLSTGYNNTFFGDYENVVKSFDELRYFTNLTAISDHAFDGCSNLTSITIPEGVTSIGYRAFYYCWRLASVTIPNGITSIGSYAFSDCLSLASITIPEGVTSIGSYAFYGCSSLNDVYVANLDVIALFSTTEIFVYGANIWLDGELLTEYVFPDGTVKIDSRLRGCTSIETVVIPNDVVYIDSNAFENCYNLKSITIPNSVISIGNSAFYNCSSLASVTIPEGVTSIGVYAFGGCSSLASVTIPEGVTSIGVYAFSGCSSLASVTIPDGITSIGLGVFKNCSSLASVTIPEGVTSIGVYAFEGCERLTSISIPEGITSIGDCAFSGCSSIASITIPESVTSIGDWAFGSTSIGNSAFSSLAEVYCKPTTPPMGGNNMFANNASGRKIYVPAASVEAYKTAEGWSNYAYAIEGYDFE